MYSINLEVFGHTITLSYNDIELLRKFAPLQMGEHNFYKILNHDEFLNKLRILLQYNFRRTAQFIGWNHSVQKVIDVGSGISSFDLILYKLVTANSNKTQPMFYLVDKSERSGGHSMPYVDNAADHGCYNSWNCVEDCISASNISRENFCFLDPEQPWPDHVDLVVSQYSWLWHYPSQVYLERAFNSLRPGGKLIVDLLYLKNKDQVKEISDIFGTLPVDSIELPPDGSSANYTSGVHPFFKKPMTELYHNINGKIGKTCCWIKP